MAEEGASGTSGAAGPQKGIDRRTFVKGAVVGAAGGAVAAGGLAGVAWLTGTSESDAPMEVEYQGAKVLKGSPTKVGVPLVPITIGGDGYVHGRADDMRPFLYCGRAKSWPGGDAAYAGDDHLRYAIGPGRLEQVPDEAERREKWWYYDRLGERIHVDHLRDLPHGEGVLFTWRSAGATEYARFYGVLLKLRRDEIQAAAKEAGALRTAMSDEHDLVAFDAACTHFCCTAGWHEDEVAKTLGSWETIFCICHNARFDPRQIESYSFTLRAEEVPGAK